MYRTPVFNVYVFAFLLVLPLGAQSAQVRLEPGDILPALIGRALNGQPLALPSAARGQPAAVIFSFSRAGGKDARRWSHALSTDEPQWPIYTAIFLQSVPELFRGLAKSEIKSGVPASQDGRTLVREEDEALWKERLGVKDSADAYVVLLGADGHLRWMSSGPYSDRQYARLKSQASNLR